MGIREEREAQAAQFVSVHDLLEGLAAAEATTIKEVAGYLLHKLRNEGAPRFIQRDAQSLAHFKADANQADKLLRYVSHWGAFEESEHGYGQPSLEEFDTHGWFREEMAGFLKGLDVEAPPCCSPLWKPEPKRPYWMKTYDGQVRLSINEAAYLLLGIDPEEEHPFGFNGEDEEGIRHYRRLKKALIDAVNYGAWEFDPSAWGVDQGDQTILHSGIRAWAKATNAPWPFLDSTKAPAPESPAGRAMASELSVAKARIAELEQELQAQRQTGSDIPQPTRLMALAIEVQKQFWVTFDADAPGARPPSQSEIIPWLESTYGVSNAEAKAVEKVACPVDRNPANKK